MAGETILHVAYDSVLMQVRESALERGGYHVVSIEGNDAARKIVNDAADLVLVGNGGDFDDRVQLVRWLAENWAQIPVVVMSASESERYPQGAIVFHGDTPNDLVALVQRVLVSHKKLRRR